MRKAIEWVDVIKSDGFGHILPSHIFELVRGVRGEALDSIELIVRRNSYAEGSDAKALQDLLLKSIENLRKL